MMNMVKKSPSLILLVSHFIWFSPTIFSQAYSESAFELASAGLAAYKNKDLVGAAKLLQEAAAKGAREPNVLYSAASALALNGDKEKAFLFLKQAIKAGYRDVENLQRDISLTSLRKDSRWTSALVACREQQRVFLQKHRDPKYARFDTSDIARFWQAYDRAMKVPSQEWASIFQRDYIDSGTIGLKDFSWSGRLDAQNLAHKILSHQRFYRSIRSLTESIETQYDATITAFAALRVLYPDATFPDTYFVIGHMKSGGTASENGLLIGAEMFTRSSDTPTTELSNWETGAVMTQDEIPPLVAHEAVHFQQKYTPKDSLLCACLREGVADFVGELTSGHLITRMKKTHAWANSRERELWEEFRKEMDGNDTSRWLYRNSGTDTRPVDLGYWMGYKISEAHYRRAADKRRAVREMLLVKDCKGFLSASGYAEKFGVNTPK